MIKAGIFDVGGVLHKSSGTYIFQDIIQTFEINEKVFKKAWYEIIDKLGKGEITEKEFWRIFMEKTKSSKPLPKRSPLLREFIKHYDRNNDVINLVKRIKNNGYQVAVLSNSIKPHADYQYKIGIYQNFDVVVLSHEVGMQKPDPEIYKYLLRKLQLEPNETFFVDDDVNNVETAAQLGMYGIHFQNIKQLESELIALGVKI